MNAAAYSIVAQYQAEYRGIVQYYRLAYNMHQLSRLKRVTELSLVKTLAKKYKTSCTVSTSKWGRSARPSRESTRLLRSE